METIPAFDPALHPGQLVLPMRWEAIFGNARPVEVEIGAGKGSWLIKHATAHPERNFLAIEHIAKYFQLMRARVIKRKLYNVRNSAADAIDFVATIFPDKSVSAYHIYFPDPWPKKRHHKRRLLSDSFCKSLFRTLKPDGLLFFATDHEGYFEYALPILQQFFTLTEHPEAWPDAPKGRTNYEIKYMREGRRIWRLIGQPNLLKPEAG